MHLIEIMGVEVETKLDLASVENASDTNACLKENGSVPNEPIKFGSHGTEEPIKQEVKSAPSINLPKDAVVEDWPEPQQMHSFYLVKYRLFEDQKLKAKLEHAEKELQKINQARSQIIDTLKAKRAVRSELFIERKPLSAERDQYKSQIDDNKKVMKPLHEALGKLRGTNNGGGRDRGYIFSSEAELNNYIKSLEYRIVHESIPLSEEKQILKEIKQLEGTREKVIANAAEMARIQESMGEKESIQIQVKRIGSDLDGVKKKIKEIDDELDAMKNDIESLDNELTALNLQKGKIQERIMEIRKQREEGNSSFYMFRKLNFEARQLADKKDIASLRQLIDTEVEKFMTQWCSDKSFREDYERRSLQSLDMRQLCKDGRMRNPEEKPLLLQEAPTLLQPATTEAVKTNQKALKEVPGPPPSQPDASLPSEPPKEKKKTTKGSFGANVPDDDDNEEIPGVTDLPKGSTDKKDEVDEETLKQIKKEEEIAKYRQAIERKKKKEEKAAAKAELKAQREAEKKLKKKAKKKGGGLAIATDESTEEANEVAATEDAEQDKSDEKVVETATEVKYKEQQKAGALRQRTRSKGSSDIHKVILKRKKAASYWVWAGPAAAVVAILLLLAIGYKFFA